MTSERIRTEEILLLRGITRMERKEAGKPHRHLRAVIPARRVRTTAGDTPAGTGAALEGPRVELVREGGIVRAIDVTCSCGERLRVVCEYET